MACSTTPTETGLASDVTKPSSTASDGPADTSQEVVPFSPRRPEYITTNELADLCRTSPETVRYWRHVGKGPASFKLGRKVLYAAADVEEWIKARRAADRAPAVGGHVAS